MISISTKVRGETGMALWSGGLNDKSVVGMRGLLHVRGWINLSGYFLPLKAIQVTPGVALGYTSGLTGSGGNISCTRVTPARSIAYANVRLTYRQSPWSVAPDNNAPRDALFHVFFNGTIHRMKGVGSLTLGAVLPDTQAAVSDGFVVAVKTPWYKEFDARISWVGGLQGNAPVGPLNPSRPWDSYNNGASMAASYHFHKGVTVGVFEGSQSNSSGLMTATTITQTAVSGHDVGGDTL
ncbi:MAG: hypothetical protein ACYDEV_00185 [Acidiferrobacter sp.]